MTKKIRLSESQLVSLIEKIVNESSNSPSENQLRIPKHLIELAKIELDDWVDSAYRAKHCNNKEEDYEHRNQNSHWARRHSRYRDVSKSDLGGQVRRFLRCRRLEGGYGSTPYRCFPCSHGRQHRVDDGYQSSL